MGTTIADAASSNSPPAVYEREVNWTVAKDINEQSITWIGYHNETMKWGDKINVNEWALGNFTIELTDLMKDAVSSKILGALMTVTGENKKSQVVITSDESQLVNLGAPFYDDEMKIYASINGTRIWSRELLEPNASIQVFLRGKPDINLSYDIYDENPESNPDINASDSTQSGELFYIQISLENKGNATIKNVQLAVNLTNFTVPHEQLSIQRNGVSFEQSGNTIISNLDELKPNSTKVVNLSAIAPVTPADDTFFIPVIVKGIDNKNVEYTFREKRQFIVKPFIKIVKKVGPYVNYSGEDVLYVNELFTTFLEITNYGNQAVTINLTDSVPDSFVYEPDNSSLNWTIIIPAKSSQTVMYSIRPIKYTEKVTIPGAAARFEFEGRRYSVVSNDMEVKVKGAEVTLTKDVKIDQQIDGIINATIMINAKNMGDQRVFLKINDSLPDNASLIKGSTSRDSIFIDKNGLYSYSYEISVPFLEEGIILPSAEGYFVDFRTYIEEDRSRKKDFWRKTESNKPVIGIRQAAPVPKPENISQEPENITPPASVKKEEIKSKFVILKNLIFELIGLLMGKEKAGGIQPSPSPQIQHVTKRIDETHSSFTWTVGWESQENANASGKTWKVSVTPGSMVTMSFTGTGASLIYGAGQGGGIANIELDGKAYPDIDMYSPVPQSNISSTIAGGLENTQHTLSITVSGKKNPEASNSIVVVDAVEITQS